MALQRVMACGFALVAFEKYIYVTIASRYTDNFGQTPFYISKKGTSILGHSGWGFRLDDLGTTVAVTNAILGMMIRYICRKCRLKQYTLVKKSSPATDVEVGGNALGAKFTQ